mmetsp:Transcript_12939/g.33017  ORF Transcript_12939/g.33017 Transcript_12939/m.33017 type:complete len:238 (+) Transcript_12939:2210-2923(+)
MLHDTVRQRRHLPRRVGHPHGGDHHCTAAVAGVLGGAPGRGQAGGMQGGNPAVCGCRPALPLPARQGVQPIPRSREPQPFSVGLHPRVLPGLLPRPPAAHVRVPHAVSGHVWRGTHAACAAAAGPPPSRHRHVLGNTQGTGGQAGAQHAAPGAVRPAAPAARPHARGGDGCAAAAVQAERVHAGRNRPTATRTVPHNTPRVCGGSRAHPGHGGHLPRVPRAGAHRACLADQPADQLV